MLSLWGLVILTVLHTSASEKIANPALDKALDKKEAKDLLPNLPQTVKPIEFSQNFNKKSFESGHQNFIKKVDAVKVQNKQLNNDSTKPEIICGNAPAAKTNENVDSKEKITVKKRENNPAPNYHGKENTNKNMSSRRSNEFENKKKTEKKNSKQNFNHDEKQVSVNNYKKLRNKKKKKPSNPLQKVILGKDGMIHILNLTPVWKLRRNSNQFEPQSAHLFPESIQPRFSKKNLNSKFKKLGNYINSPNDYLNKNRRMPPQEIVMDLPYLRSKMMRRNEKRNNRFAKIETNSTDNKHEIVKTTNKSSKDKVEDTLASIVDAALAAHESNEHLSRTLIAIKVSQDNATKGVKSQNVALMSSLKAANIARKSNGLLYSVLNKRKPVAGIHPLDLNYKAEKKILSKAVNELTNAQKHNSEIANSIDKAIANSKNGIKRDRLYQALLKSVNAVRLAHLSNVKKLPTLVKTVDLNPDVYVALQDNIMDKIGDHLSQRSRQEFSAALKSARKLKI